MRTIILFLVFFLKNFQIDLFLPQIMFITPEEEVEKICLIKSRKTNKTLNSLTKQAYSKSFEVVVVEDGSENISKEIVEKYSNESPKN